jgi:hypothetical protein
MLKSDSEAIVSERHGSLDKNKEENRQREIRGGTERCQRGWFTISIQYKKLQSLQCMRGCSEELIVSFSIGFPSTNPIPPKQQNSGVPILISKLRHQYLHECWVLMISKEWITSRITLSNLAALLARANVLVWYEWIVECYMQHDTLWWEFPGKYLFPIRHKTKCLLA